MGFQSIINSEGKQKLANLRADSMPRSHKVSTVKESTAMLDWIIDRYIIEFPLHVCSLEEVQRKEEMP